MQPDNHPVNSEIVEDTAQIGETLFDSFLSEQLGNALNVADENIELLQDIPVVNIVAASYKVWKQSKTYIMKKKLYKFLFQLGSTSENERRNFAKKLENDKKLKERVCENLILILEKIDDMKKAEILGNLFAAYIKEKIHSENYHRLNVMINRAYISDLKELYQNHSDLTKIDLSIRKQLANGGFLQEQTIYDLSEIGGATWGLSEEEKEQEEKEQDRQRFSITYHGQLFIDLNLYS